MADLTHGQVAEASWNSGLVVGDGETLTSLESDRLADIVMDLLAAAPQPRVLWRTSTAESNERWFAEDGKSFLGDSIQLDVPHGTRVVVIEDPEPPAPEPVPPPYDEVIRDVVAKATRPVTEESAGG